MYTCTTMYVPAHTWIRYLWETWSQVKTQYEYLQRVILEHPKDRALIGHEKHKDTCRENLNNQSSLAKVLLIGNCPYFPLCPVSDPCNKRCHIHILIQHIHTHTPSLYIHTFIYMCTFMSTLLLIHTNSHYCVNIHVTAFKSPSPLHAHIHIQIHITIFITIHINININITNALPITFLSFSEHL